MSIVLSFRFPARGIGSQDRGITSIVSLSLQSQNATSQPASTGAAETIEIYSCTMLRMEFGEKCCAAKFVHALVHVSDVGRIMSD